MDTHIDHFMYAVRDLDEGISWAADVFGTAPAYGGEHVGLGTRNALLSFGDTYLEIIAPDPAQTLTGNFGAALASLAEPGLVTWAARGPLGPISETLAAEGVTSRGPQRTQRQTADGELLVWELLFPANAPWGMPFFIDWLDCPHPSTTTPRGGQLASFSIRSPDAERLAAVLSRLGLTLPIEDGEPGLELAVTGEQGTVTLSRSAASLSTTPG